MAIKLLRTLIAISEKGSFNCAADQICITPAAVSQQMKKLEEIFNLELFDRSRRTPNLTLAGKALIPRAREIVRNYDEMVNDLQNELPISGEFTIGAVSSTLSSLLPASIKALLHDYPEIHIRLITATSHDLLHQLDRGAIDAAIMSKPLQQRNHLKWQTIAVEDMVLICSNELTSNDPIKLLETNPYIRVTRHTLVGVLADDVLHDTHLNIQDTMELESLDSVTSMVSHNLGVAIVPRPCVMDPRYDGLKMIPIGKETKCREMGILSRQDNRKFRMVERLLESLLVIIDKPK